MLKLFCLQPGGPKSCIIKLFRDRMGVKNYVRPRTFPSESSQQKNKLKIWQQQEAVEE